MSGARHFRNEHERKRKAALREARERNAAAPPAVQPRIDSSPGERPDLSGQIGADAEHVSSEKIVPAAQPPAATLEQSLSGSAVGSSVADEIQSDCSGASPLSGVPKPRTRAREDRDALLLSAREAFEQLRAFMNTELERYRAKQARGEPLTRVEQRAFNRAVYAAQHVAKAGAMIAREPRAPRRIRGVDAWFRNNDATAIDGAAESGSSSGLR